MWQSMNAAKAIGKELGPVLTVDPDSEDFNGMGFLCDCIDIDVSEPLQGSSQPCWVRVRTQCLLNSKGSLITAITVEC